MDFENVIKKRKMVRKFRQNKPISDKIISKLIRNAHRAPSAGHTQVQEFIIVKDPSIKKKLRIVAVDQEYVEDAPVLIIVCSNTSRSVGRYGIRGRDFYSIIDGAFASMLILLTAVNEGIGVCFVGAFDDIKVSKILEIPKQVRPIGILKLVSQIISINTYIIGLLGYYIEDFLPRIGIANSNSVVQFFSYFFFS
jgi:nitroreductase